MGDFPQKPAAEIAKRSLAEWITFAVSATILLTLVGLVIYDWYVAQDRPPAFRVEVSESVRVMEDYYYVPFTIINTGRAIARNVQVTAEMHLKNQGTETGEQQIDFLSGHERKRGSFVFTHNPETGELIIRVASYSLP